MSTKELQYIMKALHDVDTESISPKLILWLRELFLQYGQVLRKGDDLEPEINDYLKFIPKEILTTVLNEIFEPPNIEYKLYAYNKKLDYCMANECEGKEEYEEFIEDIDDVAENILSWRDDYDLILKALGKLKVEKINLFPLWKEYFEMISVYDNFLMEHIYVRPKFAKSWKAYAEREGIPSDCWWFAPRLVENKPILLPIEIREAEIDSLNVQIPDHVLEEARERIFGKSTEKSITERVKENAIAVKEKFTETFNDIIRQLQPYPLPQPAMIRSPAVNAVTASATLYLSGKRPEARASKGTVILDEQENIYCDVEIKELGFTKKNGKLRRLFNLQFDIWHGLADVRVTLNDRQGNTVSNLTDSSGESYLQDIKRGDYEIVISDAADNELFREKVKLEKEIQRMVKDNIEVILERRTNGKEGHDIKVHKKTGTEVTLIDSKSRENICRPTGYAHLFVFNKIPDGKYDVKFNVHKDGQEYSYVHKFDLPTLDSTTANTD
ncbi:MAG: collagen binding domain-containing protein, partial [Thermodesulfobacteriota bacterium]